jgi:hypothetical protein
MRHPGPAQLVDVTASIKRTHVVKGLIGEYRRAAWRAQKTPAQSQYASCGTAQARGSDFRQVVAFAREPALFSDGSGAGAALDDRRGCPAIAVQLGHPATFTVTMTTPQVVAMAE